MVREVTVTHPAEAVTQEVVGLPSADTFTRALSRAEDLMLRAPAT